ncbi:MAG: exopolysaccharide biosynthesis protein, partial [Propylenella sp.]
VCLYLAILLLLPLPLLNFAPAVCLVAIALAMVQRDGILMLVGLAGTALLTLSLGFVAQWLSALFAGLREFGA